MSLALKALANGKLPVTKTALYTCPAGMAARAHITIHNTDSATRRFLLYVKTSGGTSRIYADHAIEAGDTSHTPKDGPIILEAGDAVEGQCPDGATYMDYIVNGPLETLVIS